MTDTDDKTAEDSKDQQTDKTTGRFVAPWATGDRLRKIEHDVLIPNLMKKKAKVLCKETMDAFSKCTSGRTLSLAWSCKQELEDMKKCIKAQKKELHKTLTSKIRLDRPELFEESKEEYLKRRENFQNHYVETGEMKDPKRKDALF